MMDLRQRQPFETTGCPSCSSASMTMWAASGSRRARLLDNSGQKIDNRTKPIFCGRRQLIEAPPTPSATTAYWATLRSEAILEAWFGDNG
jgi:hypothetical protein